MSTLKVNTVQHNTTGFNNVVQFTDGGGTENGQLARAWVSFNGQGTVAIRADFNINTVADNGTGTFTINFSNSMPDAYYAMGNLCQEDSGGGNRQMNGRGSRTASAMPVDTRDGSNGLGDYAHNTACFFR